MVDLKQQSFKRWQRYVSQASWKNENEIGRQFIHECDNLLKAKKTKTKS